MNTIHISDMDPSCNASEDIAVCSSSSSHSYLEQLVLEGERGHRFRPDASSPDFVEIVYFSLVVTSSLRGTGMMEKGNSRSRAAKCEAKRVSIHQWITSNKPGSFFFLCPFVQTFHPSASSKPTSSSMILRFILVEAVSESCRLFSGV